MAAGAIGPIIGQIENHDRCMPRRSVRLSLALAVCAVALTACAWDPPTIERTPREAAGTESSAKSRLAARKGVPQNGTASSGPPGEKLEVPGTEMAALEVDLTNFKERLIGLDSDEINDLMGTPGLERAEPPALIWQYRHQICTVDIFMFDDGGGATVDHVEVRPTAGGSVNEKECFTALLRNVPPTGASSAKAGPPVAPAPSTPVGRRPAPSAAPASAPAQTPSSSRPPVPSTAAPSAAPATPPARPPAANAIPEGEEGPPPTDTDVDFDFGPPPATPGGPPPAAQNRLPSAAPSSEAIPTLPPEISGEKPSTPPPGPASSLGGIEVPPSASVDDEFADPLSSAPPAAPPATIAKPTIEKSVASPPPAPLAAVPPSAPAPLPVVTPPVATPTPSAPPPIPSAAVVPPPPLAISPAPLTPALPSTTATAAAQPKGAPKGAAARPVEMIDDEDLPPDLLLGRRAEDDPSRNNEDMVE
jgi:hypothetical protein